LTSLKNEIMTTFLKSSYSPPHNLDRHVPHSTRQGKRDIQLQSQKKSKF